MADLSALQNVGLTEIESKVYVALLELGASTAGTIIRKTQFHKATVYVVLDKLIERGLVNYIIQNNARFFDAVEPEKLLEIMNEKTKNLEKLIPELKKKKGAIKLEQDAYIYKGIHALESVCESILDELNPHGTYVDLGVSGLFKDILAKYWYKWQTKKRYYGIKSKCLFDENVKKKKNFLEEYYGKSKFVPHEYYCPSDTLVFNDKIVIFIWTAIPPLAIVIKSKQTAEGYKRYFNWLWKTAKK